MTNLTIPPEVEYTERLVAARKRLLSAALDQPHPSKALTAALNSYLTLTENPAALKGGK